MPDDKTPVGDAMTHRFPEQQIPDDKPGATERERIEQDVSDADLTQPADVGARNQPFIAPREEK